MWLAYLIALILGGGILLIQVLAGSDHDVGLGGLDASVDVDAGGGHAAAHGPTLLSLRSLTYGLFTFGLVGGPLDILGLTTPRVALVVALATGVGATLAVGLMFHNLADPSASGEAGLHETRGLHGRVLLPCAHQRPGKIRVLLKGQYVDMLATTDEEPIAVGSEVLILEVRDDVAHVATLPRLGGLET